jgi:hypothetical protein
VEAWQTAMAAEATMAAALTLISDTAVTLTRSQQSAADGGPLGDNNSATIVMQ